MIDFNDIFKDYVILDKEEVRNQILTEAYSKEKLERIFAIRVAKDTVNDTRFHPVLMILVSSLKQILDDPDYYLVEYRGDEEILDESDRYLGRRMIEKIF